MAEVILNKDNFEEEVLKSDKPVIVDFWAEWCGPCKKLGPIIAQIAEEKRLADEKSADEQLTKTIRAAFPQDRKFVNEYTEQAYIGQIKAELNKPENKGKGIGEIFETLTKDKADIFANPNPVSNMAGFGGASIDTVDDAKVRRVMGLPVKE